MIGEMQTCSLQTICLSSLGMYITFSSIVLSSKNTAYIGTVQYNSPCENPPVKYKYINQRNWTIYIFLSQVCVPFRTQASVAAAQLKKE